MIKHISEGYVNTETKKGITTITFHHPQSNSLPSALLENLASTISIEASNEYCKVIVLKSEGEKAFCAGASFDELVSISSKEEGLRFFSGFAKVINAMRKAPKFIIARVHAKCVGGGVGIASAADYVIAYKDASIKLSELAVGIGPFVVGPAVERKLGMAAFSALAVDAGMWRDSDWAKKKGLFAEVHPTIESMDESISRLSHTLSLSSPEAMREMKQMFWQGTENWDKMLAERAAISGRLVLSDFTREAIQKFKNK